MVKTYHVSGMTCMGCVASVQKKLSAIDGVETVQVDFEKAQAELKTNRPVPLEELKNILPSKYSIEEGKETVELLETTVSKSKLQQLKPLYLIFAYLLGAAILLNYKNWSMQGAMLDFMGLFYIVFSFFKFLDLKGFPESFKMYDPLAKVLPAYGWLYPFLELGLGLLFLMRVQIQLALIITVVILSITTFGVTKTLLGKKSIRCACLGTALNLPMTEATFIENAIMLVMAVAMLVQ